MRNKAEFYFISALILVCGAAFVAALGFPTRSGLFPLVISGAATCLAGLKFVSLLRTKTVTTGSVVKSESSVKETLIVLGWILAFFGSVVLFGFTWGLSCMTFLYLKFMGQKRLILSILLAAAVGVFLFSVWPLMHLRLYEGILWQAVQQVRGG